ncbi:10330_t:CDS:2, partial [Entrophospora sp. SA101]
FKANDNVVMVASDVASRGLDIHQVDHVIHYHLPRSSDIYVHRSGRTARASKEGVSLILCSPEELSLYRKLCQKLNKVGIAEFPTNGGFVNMMKQRIELARQIDQDEHKLQKTNFEEDWYKKAAKDLDVDLDDNSSSVLPEGHFCLTSFHKYQPRICMIKYSNHGDSNDEKYFTFEKATFIAVTHYQNETVNTLKKNYNPHAKGFKESDFNNNNTNRLNDTNRQRVIRRSSLEESLRQRKLNSCISLPSVKLYYSSTNNKNTTTKSLPSQTPPLLHSSPHPSSSYQQNQRQNSYFPQISNHSNQWNQEYYQLSTPVTPATSTTQNIPISTNDITDYCDFQYIRERYGTEAEKEADFVVADWN